MTTYDLDYVSDQFEREEKVSMRPGERRWRTKKRPEYARKRTPVRKGMKFRSNNRRTVQ